MKKYIEPKIKAVELDPKQAVMQVCVVGGIYLNANVPPWCGSVIETIGGINCVDSPKGGSGGNSSMNIYAQSEPPS